MYCIRRGVFETNSSSSHSISFCNSDKDKLLKNNLDIDKDNCIYAAFNSFGWENAEYTDQFTKFQYICTMWAMLEIDNKCCNINDIYNTVGFKLIDECVKKHCACKRFVVDLNASDVEENGTLRLKYESGYIDHNSVKKSQNNIKKYLKDNNLDIYNFIFNNKVVLTTGNDN